MYEQHPAAQRPSWPSQPELPSKQHSTSTCPRAAGPKRVETRGFLARQRAVPDCGLFGQSSDRETQMT